MSIQILTSPIRTIRGLLSNVTAGISQIPYRLQRQDFALASTSTDGSSNLVLNCNASAGDITSIINEGDMVYAKGANLELGQLVVISMNWTGVFSQIICDGTYTIDAGTGYVNLITNRQDYKMLLNVAIPSTNEQILPLALSYTPKADGSLFVNIANMLVELSVNTSAINFKLAYSEYYNGQIVNTNYHDPVFAVASKRQIQDEGGANMWRYLPNLVATEGGIGKQLTEFATPFIYVGWRAWASTIYDENINTRLGGLNVGFRFDAVDVNYQFLDQQVFFQLPQNLPRIHSTDISEELKTVANAYYIRVFLMAVNGGQNTTLQTRNYIIKKPCRNPVMIEWMGRNGSQEQYMFSHNQNVDTEAKPGVTYETPIQDTLDNIVATIKRLTDGSIQYMTLTAENIPRQHMEVLKYLKESTLIFLWLDPQGEKYIQVVVSETFSTPIATKEQRGSFSVQLRLPQDFDFFKPVD